jgi:hypothetical protein
MKRRDFLALLGGAAAAWPLAARAQQAGRIYRIAPLTLNPRSAPHYAAFFEGLSQFGFTEGRNLVVDGRGFSLRADQLLTVASEIAKSNPDLIFAMSGDPAIRAA